MPSISDASAKENVWIALLGRRDIPVDGVEDYCNFLAQSLRDEGVRLELYRMDWDRSSRIGALLRLGRTARDWRGKWVLVQYTALGWSRRGFTGYLLAVIRILRFRKANVAVVFHEPSRQLSGSRGIDRLRGGLQDRVIRGLYAAADKAIFADPLHTISWLPDVHRKAAFIPIGANIPELSRPMPAAAQSNDMKTVAIYCLSPSPNHLNELSDISAAVEFSAQRGLKIRVVFLGRGTEQAEEEIRRYFAASSGEVEVLGLQKPEGISRILAGSDAMLCVRGALFPRRGSAIAGIACGLPVIAYTDGQNVSPLDKAGLVLVPYRDAKALGEALARVLEDSQLRETLQRKNAEAFGTYFSWGAIARSFRAALGEDAHRE